MAEVSRLTEPYPGAHGGPIHWGDPSELGLSAEALGSPPFGEAVSIREGEIPVFWCCGVTPQQVRVPCTRQDPPDPG